MILHERDRGIDEEERGSRTEHVLEELGSRLELVLDVELREIRGAHHGR